MSNFCCDYKCNCTTLAFAASLVIGIVTAFLRLTAVITLTPAFLWVVFGIAVVYLAVNLVTAALTQGYGTRGCACSVYSALLLGALGTILLSVVLLAVEFAATSVIGAIIAGALLLLFSLMITSTACLIKCLTRCNND